MTPALAAAAAAATAPAVMTPITLALLWLPRQSAAHSGKAEDGCGSNGVGKHYEDASDQMIDKIQRKYKGNKGKGVVWLSWCCLVVCLMRFAEVGIAEWLYGLADL